MQSPFSRTPQTPKNWPRSKCSGDRRLDVHDPRRVMRVQLGQELAVVDPDPLRNGLALAVHEDVEVLMDVQHLALGRQRGHTDGVEPVGQRVEAGVPRSGPCLEARELALLRHDRAGPSLPPRVAGIIITIAPSPRRPRQPLPARGRAPSGEAPRDAWGRCAAGAPVDLAWLCRRAGFLGHGRAMLRKALDSCSRGRVSVVASDPEGRKVFRIWRFLWPLRIHPVETPQGGYG